MASIQRFHSPSGPAVLHLHRVMLPQHRVTRGPHIMSMHMRRSLSCADSVLRERRRGTLSALSLSAKSKSSKGGQVT